MSVVIVQVGTVQLSPILHAPLCTREVKKSLCDTVAGNSRNVGGSNRGIIWYHIIPNCIPTIIVQATIRIGSGILYASGLSYLGLGVQPPNPEWGAMLSGGRQFLMEAPHITIFPGIFIMVTILAFNLLGDGLRDALDPRMKQ